MTQPAVKRKAYRVAEVAEMMGISQITVTRAINTGELDSFRIGRAILVTEDAIDAYIRRLSGRKE